jgi:polyhydroxyalkanoate synthesis regulator phasin
MKKYLIIVCLAGMLLTGLQTAARAVTEMEILVDKLVEKGILTPAEGDKILRETQAEAKKQQEAVIKQAKKEVIPEWVQKTRLTGDFRLRYQWDDRDGSDQRNRFRFRARLALETKIAETLKFTFGIASGPTDPRSTNQTMSDVFSHKQLNIDLAYVDWKPYDWVSVLGGKMKNPVYTVDQLIWDNDIRPEGVAAQFNRKFNDNLTGFLTAGVFILGENSVSNNNPYMFVIQPGIDWNFAECSKLKYALGWTNVPNIEGKPQLAYSAKTNTYEKNKAGTTVYKYGYNLLTMTGEVGFKNPVHNMVNYAALFGEFTHNTAASKRNNGFMTGFYFGDEKVTDKKQWQFKYSFRRLEADADLDVLPDSDFYGGATGVYGHKATIQYGLMKNVWYEMNYFRSEKLDSPKNPENIIQTDLNFKF